MIPDPMAIWTQTKAPSGTDTTAITKDNLAPGAPSFG